MAPAFVSPNYAIERFYLIAGRENFDRFGGRLGVRASCQLASTYRPTSSMSSFQVVMRAKPVLRHTKVE
ncbi:unnamed protein product [Larinioides sclopetarius]|uniref:Uncharacterized protein n=1 Tax=Larinioides sclopetarius TaxID=280406 RepID=A0AAV2BZ54_9ARAC